jgi:hypothetical protein
VNVRRPRAPVTGAAADPRDAVGAPGTCGGDGRPRTTAPRRRRAFRSQRRTPGRRARASRPLGLAGRTGTRDDASSPFTWTSVKWRPGSNSTMRATQEARNGSGGRSRTDRVICVPTPAEADDPPSMLLISAASSGGMSRGRLVGFEKKWNTRSRGTGIHCSNPTRWIISARGGGSTTYPEGFPRSASSSRGNSARCSSRGARPPRPSCRRGTC